MRPTIYATPEPAELPGPLPTPDPSTDERTMRRAFRKQIAQLERELAFYAPHDRRPPSPPRLPGAEPAGHIATVEELERTRAELIERLARLRGEAQRRGELESAARAHIERMAADPAGHRWEMVTSEQTGDPGCRNWRVVPRFGPLGAITGWWRVRVSSGCPLAAPLAAVDERATGMRG